MIPVSSVVDMDGKKGVFLVNRDAIRFQPVALGNTLGSQIEVIEGLSGGEEIVVQAADNNLENGQKVRRKSE